MRSIPFFLICFLTVSVIFPAYAVEVKYPAWRGFTFYKIEKYNDRPFDPYLEDVRHLQLPQWRFEDWYAQDWLNEKDGMRLVEGFYRAQILADQKTGKNKMPVLVVGPNFYRLSGLDKRKVVTTVDTVYGITAQDPQTGSFLLQDWHTKRYIGAFDQEGLRLH
jgi:hypothetical protein